MGKPDIKLDSGMDAIIAALPAEQKLHFLIGWVIGFTALLGAMHDPRFAGIIEDSRRVTRLLRQAGNEDGFKLKSKVDTE